MRTAVPADMIIQLTPLHSQFVCVSEVWLQLRAGGTGSWRSRSSVSLPDIGWVPEAKCFDARTNYACSAFIS